MTRDDIIRMAREAADPDAVDPLCGSDWGDLITLDLDEMVRFAALVAAKEREACAKVCKANARLIAAAPDLLAELQWMRNHWEPTEGKVGDATLLNAKGDEICEWMARVDSVLARCTPQPAEAIRARGE